MAAEPRAAPLDRDLEIRPVTDRDAAALVDIYNPYVLDTCITFETVPIESSEMLQRIRESAASELPWLVAVASGQVVGYAYATRWKGRCAYRYSVESTVYLAAGYGGKGIGKQLYQALIEALQARTMRVVIGGIALPNAPSVGLHERLGFRKVAHFEQVGFKQDRWIDVGYWQLLLASRERT